MYLGCEDIRATIQNVFKVGIGQPVYIFILDTSSLHYYGPVVA